MAFFEYAYAPVNNNIVTPVRWVLWMEAHGRCHRTLKLIPSSEQTVVLTANEY